MPDPRLNELEQVEEPFLRQLERLKWNILRGCGYGHGDIERCGGVVRYGLTRPNAGWNGLEVGRRLPAYSTPSSGIYRRCCANARGRHEGERRTCGPHLQEEILHPQRQSGARRSQRTLSQDDRIGRVTLVGRVRRGGW